MGKVSKTGAVGLPSRPVAKGKSKEAEEKKTSSNLVPLVLVYGWTSRCDVWVNLLMEFTGDNTFKELYDKTNEPIRPNEKDNSNDYLYNAMHYNRLQKEKEEKIKEKEIRDAKLIKEFIELAEKYNIYIYDYSNRFLVDAGYYKGEDKTFTEITTKSNSGDRKLVVTDRNSSKNVPKSALSMTNPEIVAIDFRSYLQSSGLLSKEFNVVAYSMGGLVTREAIEFLDVTVNKFVMIATPNQGTKLADHIVAKFIGGAVNYMKPDSRGLRELNSMRNIITLRRNVNEISMIGTRNDGVVLPYTNVEIPNSNIKPVYYQKHSHSSLPRSRNVISRIKKLLYETDKLFEEAPKCEGVQ